MEAYTQILMAKNKNKKSGIVFSTDPDYEYEEDLLAEVETLPPSQQNLLITLQRLKGNKVVTKVYNFEGTEEDLKALGKELKSLCGCGGSVKNGEILLQGDFREKVKQTLDHEGYKYKTVGG